MCIAFRTNDTVRIKGRRTLRITKCVLTFDVHVTGYHPVLVQFPFYIVMVFDEWQNGIPVAYYITSTSKQTDLTPWLESLKKKMTDS